MKKKKLIELEAEISIYEVIKRFIEGKYLFLILALISLVISLSYVAIQKDVYHSNIDIIQNDFSNSYFREVRIASSFEKKIYSKSIFDQWKSSSEDIVLKFKDFSNYYQLDGFKYAVINDQLIEISNNLRDEERSSFIISVLIKSNDQDLISNFYDYTNYVIKLIEVDMIEELNFRRSVLNSFSNSPVRPSFSEYLGVDLYTYYIENEEDFFTITQPTFPIKIETNYVVLVIMSVLSSMMIGIIIIFFIHPIFRTFRTEFKKLK